MTTDFYLAWMAEQDTRTAWESDQRNKLASLLESLARNPRAIIYWDFKMWKLVEAFGTREQHQSCLRLWLYSKDFLGSTMAYTPGGIQSS